MKAYKEDYEVGMQYMVNKHGLSSSRSKERPKHAEMMAQIPRHASIQAKA